MVVGRGPGGCNVSEASGQATSVAELVNSAGAAPAQPAAQPEPAKPAEPTIPEGHRLVPEDQYAKLERNSHRVSGMEKVFSAAAQAGLTDPSQIAAVGELHRELLSQGYTPQKAMEIIRSAGQPTAQPAAPQPQAGQSTEGMTPEEIRELVSTQFAEQNAQAEHDRAMQAESQLVNQHLKPLLDSVPSDRHEMFKEIVQGYLDQKRSFYDAEHPLRTVAFRPLDEAGVKSAIESMAAVFGKAPAQAGATPSNAAPATAPQRPGYQQTAVAASDPRAAQAPVSREQHARKFAEEYMARRAEQTA